MRRATAWGVLVAVLLGLVGCDGDDSPLVGEGVGAEIVNDSSEEVVVHAGSTGEEWFRLEPGEGENLSRGDGICTRHIVEARTTSGELIGRFRPPICEALWRISDEDLP